MNVLNFFRKSCSPFPAILIIILLLACTNTSKKAEENLDLLRLKTLALDSIITVESNRLKILDSSVNDELEKVGKLDSIVNAESLRIDSIVTKVYKQIRQKNSKE